MLRFVVSALILANAAAFSLGPAALSPKLGSTASSFRATGQRSGCQSSFSLRRTAQSIRMMSTDTDGTTQSDSAPVSTKGKLLVLGGTGFVGGVIASLAVQRGYQVVSLSRRDSPPPESRLVKDGLVNKVEFRVGNAADSEEVDAVLSEGGFIGVVHAIGMLLESDLNRIASGSGSVPAPDATYDMITRQTAFNALDAVEKNGPKAKDGSPMPFVFVSAAEAGWDFDSSFQGTPVEWLHRYLVAKRAVEDRLSDMGQQGSLRPVVVRPSIIWTWDNPGALPTVAAFTLGNSLGLPFVDKPVTVDTLARAILKSVETPAESGVKNFMEMERLAKSLF